MKSPSEFNFFVLLTRFKILAKLCLLLVSLVLVKLSTYFLLVES